MVPALTVSVSPLKISQEYENKPLIAEVKNWYTGKQYTYF